MPVMRLTLNNPLRLFTTLSEVAGMEEMVECFASSHGLKSKADILQKAARIARDWFNTLRDEYLLSEEEKDIVREERKVSFYKQTRSLQCSVLVVSSLSAICQGWNQSILNASGTVRDGESRLSTMLTDDRPVYRPGFGTLERTEATTRLP